MREARRVAAHGAHLQWQINSLSSENRRESGLYLGCIDGLRHDQHPRARGGRGEGDREVRVRGRRGWAGGLRPLGVMRVEARHELLLLQATSFSPWDENTSIWYNFFRGIYIKLPRLYTITWSREGYLFCQCHRNVNWRALIKNKSVDKLYKRQLEMQWLSCREDRRQVRPETAQTQTRVKREEHYWYKSSIMRQKDPKPRLIWPQSIFG